MTYKKVSVRQRTSYSFEEKLIVVKYAQEHGRNVTAKHFNLNAPMVGRWIKQSDKWEEENKKKNVLELQEEKPFILKQKIFYIVG
jgi:transposase-like protein